MKKTSPIISNFEILFPKSAKFSEKKQDYCVCTW